ncbi:MAG: tRNA (guanosine(37)-N1)-methyltransferase TrmD [Bacillota bacterium]|nr:MAG: tRNA (guanosine(37)-N1)-methyltransferase TrmD [Bacillota bacterium]
MRFDVLTLFPEMFRGPLDASILGRARQAGLIDIVIHDIRDYAEDRHRTADDYPYGGGAGMVLKPGPVFRLVDSLCPGWEKAPRGTGSKIPGLWLVYLTPQGRPLDQATARRLAGVDRLVLLAGHYEGTDERIREALVDEELSIGDYVLTGGEIPAMVVIDAVARLIPGVLGQEVSPLEESFTEGLLEYPHYTRPADFRGLRVPEVLLSGNHERVRRWRRKESIRRTLERRPELLLQARLTREDHQLLRELLEESGAGSVSAEAQAGPAAPDGDEEGRKAGSGPDQAC